MTQAQKRHKLIVRALKLALNEIDRKRLVYTDDTKEELHPRVILALEEIKTTLSKL